MDNFKPHTIQIIKNNNYWHYFHHNCHFYSIIETIDLGFEVAFSGFIVNITKKRYAEYRTFEEAKEAIETVYARAVLLSL